MFTKAFFVLGFDLASERESNEEHICLPPQENVCILALYKKMLREPVTRILYAEFPGNIEIDNSSNITVE